MISVKNLKKTYGRGTVNREEVLHGVSFDLPKTGFVCILGRSGSGKTSLLNAIGGLDSFDKGAVDIDGTTVTPMTRGRMEKQRNTNFSYVFQNYYLLPEHSAAYNVYLGLHSLDLSEEEKIKRVGDALRKVGMHRFRKRLVGELSGGQQQRIAIARAIAKAPKVIFADEPTGNLDEESTLNICSLLKRLSKSRLVVMVTHEERLADFFADRIIRIEEGNIKSDETDWERGTLVSADRNTLYASDYKVKEVSLDALSVRVLTAENASPAELTIVVEDGRLIIKTDDKRLVMYSKTAEPPFIKEGDRPKLDPSKIDYPDDGIEEQTGIGARVKKGLGLKMLISELRTNASKKKLRNIATVLFIILLSLMVMFSASDVVEAGRVDPEEFITADSHNVKLTLDKGPEYTDRSAWSIAEYVPKYMKIFEGKDLDYDLIPDTNQRFRFISDELPQFGSLWMSLGKYNIVNVKRLDESTLIYGRMPERYDEIVIDRWVISKCTEVDGVVENLIPDNAYMLGKRLQAGKDSYFPTIVGICDSGEPSIYMTTAGILNVGVHGIEAMPYSEFVAVTGIETEPLTQGEALIVDFNASRYLKNQVGSYVTTKSGIQLHYRDIVEGVKAEHNIDTTLVIADEDVDSIYENAILTVSHFNFWCADKLAVKRVLKSPLPSDLDGVVAVTVTDTYSDEYNSFMAGRLNRLRTRSIITASIALLCLVMLYVIQRFRVRDRMGMIAVYRLLGIPGRDTVAIFVMENVMLSLKYALPSLLLAWGVVTALPIFGVAALNITIPVWMPFAVLGAIIVCEMLVAVLAVARLVTLPPAKLAAKYDY